MAWLHFVHGVHQVGVGKVYQGEHNLYGRRQKMLGDCSIKIYSMGVRGHGKAQESQ